MPSDENSRKTAFGRTALKVGGALCAVFVGAGLIAELGPTHTFQESISMLKQNDDVGPVMATPDNFPLTRMGDVSVDYDKDNYRPFVKIFAGIAGKPGSTMIHLGSMPRFPFVPNNRKPCERSEVVTARQARQELQTPLRDIEQASVKEGIK